MNKRKSFFSILLALLVLNGCASTGKSVGAGAASGGLLGAGVGALADPGSEGQNRFRNVVIGTAVGGMVGAGAGYLLDQRMKEERQSAFAAGKKDEENSGAGTSGNAPRLLPAKTEAHWVGDAARGNTFIPGHFEYIITESAHWSAEKE